MPEVVMPQLGETVTEGTITRWLKAVGDQVERDEPLFEVSTDKVDSEVPAPASGLLVEIRVPEGDTVDVGTTLAVIGEANGAEAPPSGGPAPQGAAVGAALLPPPPPPTGAPAPAATPASAPPALSTAVPAAGGAPPLQDGGAAGGAHLVLSPVVRRLLDDNGVDPTGVPGSGPGGRITRADVLAHLDARGTGQAPARGHQGPPAPAAPSRTVPPARDEAVPAGPPPSAGDRDQVVPFTNIRRRTAEHMVRSKATSAHTLVAIEVDYENVDRVRRAEKDRFRSEEGTSLTYLAFVSRAVIEALRDFPNLNASVGDDALILHRDVHLGLAVDLDQAGLIVPVIHYADAMALRGLARAASDLAARARSRRLTADDIAGGTFTITNPGPFGTFMTVPIINQPQVGVLAMDGVRRRPVVVSLPDGSESIAIHSVGLIALSYDHRAVDGAYASRFVARVAEILQTRNWSEDL